MLEVDKAVPFACRHQIEKRIRTLPEIDGLSKETVVTSWMAKYDAIMKGDLELIDGKSADPFPQISIFTLVIY